MHTLKTHKSVEKIAKKHRLDTSFIHNQLRMGIPIEHEHTGDKDMATDIALQHLDEIPDYYTRLKKMEASAKKEHSNFKDVKEDYDPGEDDMDSPFHAVHSVHLEYDKRYCTKCKEVQLRSECKYGQTCWDLYSIPAKLKEENLHQWFKGSKSKDGKPGWVNVVTGGTCASDKPGEGTPKCVSSAKRASMTKAERLSASRRKKAADPGQQQKSGAAKPTYVKTDVKEGWSDKYKKSIDCNNPKGFSQRAHCQGRKKKMNEESDKKSKGSGKKDACYNKVKSRYSVWPSAYASGALVKCRKVGAANWGTKSEAMEEQRYCPLCDKKETRSECSYGGKAWDKVSIQDHEYSMARSELATIADAVKRLQAKVGKGEGNLEAWVQSKITKAADYIDTAADYVMSGEMDEACWVGYKQVGMKKKGKKIVPNCVPTNEETKCPKCSGKSCKCETPEPDEYNDKQLKEIGESVRLPATNGNIISIILSWRGRSYMSKMFFPQTKMPTRREITDQIQKVYPGATVLQYNVAGLEPGQPLIQVYDPQRSKNYLLNNKTIGEETAVAEKPPTKEEKRKIQLMQKLARLKAAAKAPAVVSDVSTKEEVEIQEVAAWQRKEGKNPEGGLNKKGIASYRKEHPGSKLSLAVTTKPSKLKPGSKSANRRKSFCARMSGMKKRLTSAKTANDPNSRINKSLRKWNC